VVPVRGWGLFAGLPLTPHATVAIVAIWLAYFASRRARWQAGVPVALVLLKLAVGTLAFVDRGLVAQYFANDTFAPPVERSVEFPRASRAASEGGRVPFTRVDPALDFGPAADRDLPLYFLNDLTRAADRQTATFLASTAPYSVSWTGHLLVPRDETVTAFVTGKGISGDIAIDGTVVVTLHPESTDSRASVQLHPGWRTLRVTVSGPPGADRRVYAGVIDALGVDRSFGEHEVFRREVADWRVSVDDMVRRASWLIDLMVFGYLAVRVGLSLADSLSMPWAHLVTLGLSIAAVLNAFSIATPLANRLTLLDGRMLLHESQARSILLSGSPGTASANLVALAHRVFGESLFGLRFVPPLLVGLFIALIWRVGSALVLRQRPDHPPATSPSPDQLTMALIGLGVALLLFALPHGVSGDARTRYEALVGLLEHGRVSGVAYSLVGPIFSAPLYYLGKLALGSEWWCARYNTLLFAGGLAAMYALLSGEAERRLLRTFFLILIAASMFANHVRGYDSEIFTTMCAAVGVAALSSGRERLGWVLLVLGAVNTPATMGGLLLVALWRVRRSRRLRQLAPVIVAGVLIALENWIRRGGVFESGYAGNSGSVTLLPYSGQPGFSYPFLLGVFSILFSFGKGLVFFAPGLLLPVERDLRDVSERMRACYQMWMWFVAGLILVYAKWWAWYGGWSWGPRFFLVACLPASLALAVTLHQASTLKLRSLLSAGAVLMLSAWVGIDGAVFGQGALSDICLRHDYANEFLCWYAPEFSALWRPFIAPTSVPLVELLFVGYCCVVFAWLSAPLVRPLREGKVPSTETAASS
jgi:hypothetical protein